MYNQTIAQVAKTQNTQNYTHVWKIPRRKVKIASCFRTQRI